MAVRLAGLCKGASGIVAAMVAMSSNGIGAVRTDFFGQIVTIYALIGLPVVLLGAIWFARRR